MPARGGLCGRLPRDWIVAAGMAYAAKMDRKDWLTFCLIGDAECYEGAIWEAAMLAGHHRLNNLIGILDRNRLGVTGFTEDLLRLAPLADKWSAFGWDVREVNGHSVREILLALSDVHDPKRDKPLMMIAPKAQNVERAYAQLEANQY